MLKDVTITGVYCYECDFLITVHGSPVNEDYRLATNQHSRIYHSDNKTSYNIQGTVRRPAVIEPVTKVRLEMKFQ